ncbi:MAG: alpha/beta fold hydrolase [Deltaproteobacteria bacterium]|nr:alpha/beta fold hydrolase [Deltaproteobacteria bacterium]
MPAFAQFIFWAIVVLALLLYVAWLSSRYYFAERFPDEIHFTRTEDGWRIALSRYRPEAPCNAEPVVLCHGIGANRRNLDLTDELSLAGYLAARGYDVWLIELRGRGFSARPRLFSRFRWDWCFDEYVDQDIPAGLEVVRRVTGADTVHWVGFSTGGMAMYAYLSDPRRSMSVRSAVAIAAPGSFKRQRQYLSGRLIRHARWLRHALLLRVLAPLAGYWHPAPIHIIHNPENLDGRTLRLAMVNVVVNFSRNELLQFSDWIMNDAFRSIDRRRDYRAELQRIETPMLFLAGPRDLIAPPDMVKTVFDAVGSKDKKFVICSRPGGFKVNYGHIDLVLGRNAPEEIYPLVRDWLDAHAREEIIRPADERPPPVQVAARRRPGSDEEQHDITTTYRDLGAGVATAGPSPPTAEASVEAAPGASPAPGSASAEGKAP